MTVDVPARTTANRLLVADLFARLDEDQLATPSLCEGWTCQDVLGHLVMTVDMSVPRFLLQVARDRGRADAASARLARAYGERPVADLVRVLRERSGEALSSPGVGPMGPFTDACVHLRDAAVPLGISTSPPVQDWARALAFLVTPRARAAGFLPRGRLEGLSLRASDDPWSAGDGPEVVGTAEALALAVTGRRARLDDLSGAGAPLLRRRVLARTS